MTLFMVICNTIMQHQNTVGLNVNKTVVLCFGIDLLVFEVLVYLIIVKLVTFRNRY
jgi:hypothetical protein